MEKKVKMEKKKFEKFGKNRKNLEKIGKNGKKIIRNNQKNNQ